MAACTKAQLLIPLRPVKSQGTKANGFIFVSGQMAATFEDRKIKFTEGSVADKTHQLCRNAGYVLEAAGSSLEKVVKATVRPGPTMKYWKERIMS